MKSVVTMKNVENLNKKLSNDFYIVPNLKFDIDKLRSDLEKILKKKKFNSLGIKNFAAIPLNQIPGDKSSIEDHNIRGTYWTIPDESGKEAKRDKEEYGFGTDKLFNDLSHNNNNQTQFDITIENNEIYFITRGGFEAPDVMNYGNIELTAFTSKSISRCSSIFILSGNSSKFLIIIHFNDDTLFKVSKTSFISLNFF